MKTRGWIFDDRSSTSDLSLSPGPRPTLCPDPRHMIVLHLLFCHSVLPCIPQFIHQPWTLTSLLLCLVLHWKLATTSLTSWLSTSSPFLVHLCPPYSDLFSILAPVPQSRATIWLRNQLIRSSRNAQLRYSTTSLRCLPRPNLPPLLRRFSQDQHYLINAQSISRLSLIKCLR